MQENVAGPSTRLPPALLPGSAADPDILGVNYSGSMEEHTDLPAIASDIADLSSEMMNVSLNEERELPFAISEVRSIYDTTIGRELIDAVSKNADVDGPAVGSTFFSTPKNNKNAPNGISLRAAAM